MRWQMLMAICVVAIVGAVVAAFFYDCEEVQTSRYIASWNSLFSLPTDQDEQLSKRDEASKADALAKVKQNLASGMDPCQSLTIDELRLLSGYPPMTLVHRSGKMIHAIVVVYFDRNRKTRAIFYGSDGKTARRYPIPLNVVCPELETFIPRFHLKESSFLPGLYGLDPHYRHEALTHRDKLWL